MIRTDPRPLKTSHWAALRAHVAHRAGFRCEHCHCFLGMTGQADHVVPRSACEDVGIGIFDPSNLQYLCTSCHSTKSNHERWGAVAWEGNHSARTHPRRTKLPGRDRFMDAAGIPETLQHEEIQC